MTSNSPSPAPRIIRGTTRSERITVEGGGFAAVAAGDGHDTISASLDGVYSISGGAGTDGRADVLAGNGSELIIAHLDGVYSSPAGMAWMVSSSGQTPGA